MGDLRESPAVAVVDLLEAALTGVVRVVDPYISRLPDGLAAKRVRLVALADALSAANIVVLLTDHAVFADIDPERLRGKRLIDTRGVWREAP